MRLLQLLRSLCYKVIIIILLFEIFVKEAWLDSLIILVFPAVIAVSLSQDRVEIDLADLHARINPDRLDTEHFQCPVAGKADITEPGGYMDKESQPPDRRAAFQHGNETFGFRIFLGPAKVEFIGLEHDSLFRNMDECAFIPFFHIQFMVVIDHELIGKGQVITVWIHLFRIKGINDNFFAHVADDFPAGQNHFSFLASWLKILR